MLLSVLLVMLVLITPQGSIPEIESANDSVIVLNPVSDSSAVPYKTSDRVQVSIERVKVSGSINDTLNIMLASADVSLAGFDFKIASKSSFLNIVDIIPGEIYDSCGWEFFDARSSVSESGPGIIWQVVALAETIPDAIRPLCYSFNRPASLLRLIVSSAHVDQIPDTTASIFFYWEDCTDNTMSSQSGHTLAISVQVVDFYNSIGSPTSHGFPTRQGAPMECIDPAARNKPLRMIEFHNGGVEFSSEVDLDLK